MKIKNQFAFLGTQSKTILAILMLQSIGMNLKEINQLIEWMKIGKLAFFLSGYILEMPLLMVI
jgi:hypothetical protein